MSEDNYSNYTNNVGADPITGNREGFIETIEDTLKLYRGAIETHEHIPFKEQMLLRSVVEDLKRSDLYHLGTEFGDILTEYGKQYDEVHFSECRFSEFTRPPSRKCYIRLNALEKYLDHKDDVKNIGFITEYFEDKVTKVTMCGPFASPFLVGAYHPQKGILFSKDDTIDGHPDTPVTEKMAFSANVLMMIAGAFELINNPRFVMSTDVGTRAQRKRMKREQDIALEAWHKITWNVDDDSIEVNNGDRGGWHMPLHYTRGHFRKAEPHWEDVVWRKDGKPYKWIEGFWSGHPAYGIKKGYHAPTIGKVA
jgi:hypothetical protein